MGDSVDVSAHIEDLKFMHASNVNVSNFVSVSIEDDYFIWKQQMHCLMESQKMCGIVDATFDGPAATSVEIMKQYDSLLKGWILGSLPKDVLRKVGDLKSAAEVWKKLKLMYDTEPNIITGGFVSLEFTAGTEILSLLELGNSTTRNRKLYDAIVEGRWWKAKAILKNDRDAATEAITHSGNTMLHLAVGMGQNFFVENLLNFIQNGRDIEKKNSAGQTALHIAAVVDNKDAARLLVENRKDLLNIRDHKEYTPLQSAYNNVKLNTYLYLLEASNTLGQVSNLSPYPDSYIQTSAKLLINAILTKKYDLASTLLNIYPELATRNDQILMAIAITFPTDLGVGEAFIYPSLNNVYHKIVERGSLLLNSSNILYDRAEDILWAMRSCENMYYSWLAKVIMILLVPVAILYAIYKLIHLLVLVLLFPFFMLYSLLWKVLANVVIPITNIEKRIKEQEKAQQILSFICDRIDMENFSGAHHPCYGGPILEAVRQGAYRVVAEILSRSPNTINCKNEDGHNIIQLAILNRSHKVYSLIYPIIKHVEAYRTMTDSSMNNLVHLAGRLAPSIVLSRTTGAALQLQQELQWREEVKNLMLPTELKKVNMYNETPDMVFSREHADLVKEGETWMKTTSESCSITAALIVTVVFAAAITVPGGSNQETGIPLFNKKIAFTVFAVSDATSLVAASTSLLLFLSIHTASFAEKDFLVRLPKRLIFGVFTLFLSTTTMMVAFSAILFLVFCDQRPWMLAPIVGLVWLPIGVIITLHSPLLLHIFLSTYVPIFGSQSNIDYRKSNLKNTVFLW